MVLIGESGDEEWLVRARKWMKQDKR